MSKLREAAQQVVNEHEAGFVGLSLDKAVVALRAALAEPDQASVAWKLVPVEPTQEMQDAAHQAGLEQYDAMLAHELGGAPAPVEWGAAVWSAMLAAAPEAPASAALAEPQEPVAFAFRHSDGSWHDISETEHSAGMTALYTHPAPQRQPLPKHDQHCVDVPGYGLMATKLVRAVERAHGIGGQDE